MNPALSDQVFRALDAFRIELPSWGFADTGTRFGKYPAARRRGDDRGKDCRCRPKSTSSPASARPSRSTSSGILPMGWRARLKSRACAERHGVRPGSINPNLFQDQAYKHGSFGNPDRAVRRTGAGS